MSDNIYTVLVKPLVTEKTTLGREQNKFAFVVDKKANKIEIKQAIEKMFGVKVSKVNTLNQCGKKKRVRVVQGKTADWKKAVVTLVKGQNIPLFEV